MKKIIALSAALALFTCAFSCGSKPVSDSSAPAADEQVQLMSFKSADINMSDDLAELTCTDKRGAFYLIFGKLDSGDYCGCMTTPEFQEKMTFTITPKENERILCASIMPGGKIAVLSVMGGNTAIYTYTKDCEPAETYDLGDVFDDYDNFAELLCADDGFYINIARHDLGYADKDGNYRGTVNVNGRTVCGLTMDRDGLPCVLLSEGINTCLAALDGGNIAKETDCGELAEYTNAICRGEGDYRVAVMVTGGLYALKEDKWQHITDFVDNDFGTSDILDLEMISDEEFTAVLRRLDGTYSMRLLSRRDISEIKEKKIIKLAYMYKSNTDPYSDVIKRYNADNDEYKVELVCYKGDYSEPFDRLRLDIIGGNCPDIIQFGTYMTAESFGARDSIFVDLYDYMDKDNEIRREDFLDGFLEGMENNGKLLKLAPSFSIFTNVIKDKYAKGLTSWDYDDLEMMCQTMPESMKFSNRATTATKKMLFVDLMNYGKFIDKNSGKCSYDSPEFIRAMKLVNDNGLGLSLGEYTPGFSGDTVEAFRNNEALTIDWMINSIAEIRWIKYVYAAEDFTFIGYPGDERITAYCQPTATYGIMANSPCKDEAWNFLKHFMFSEGSLWQSQFGSIPALEKLYAEEFNYECEKHPYIDPDTGEETDREYYYYYPFNVNTPTIIEMFPFDEDEAKKYDEFIRTAVKHHKYTNNNVRNILMEELDSYFEGEKSAEQVAEIIQNRVSIYLSEQY